MLLGYESQKEAAGKLATFSWIGSALYLVIFDPHAPGPVFSGGFVVVGMFVAALVFGVLIYFIQRAVARVVMSFGMDVYPPAVRLLGVVLFVAEVGGIFYIAREAYRML